MPTKTRINVQFSTSEYRSNHGAEPRGLRRWSFTLDRNPGPGSKFWVHYGTFGAAKRSAKPYFAKAQPDAGGFVTVYVQS